MTAFACAPIALTYVLPIRVGPEEPADPDLDAYLDALVGWVAGVVVVDGSPPDRFAAHARRWPAAVRHLRPERRTINGKVGGVLTGFAAARCDAIVTADDDVRWTRAQLATVPRLLEAADLVRPQQVFDPAPWHARWDTGRMLLHRAAGGDWPGTLVVRRDALPGDGYAGDVLFENLELVRTVAAAGGRVALARDLVVTRRPPATARFLEQRVRQAYDELARPWRLAVELALLPVLLAGRRPAAVGIAAAAIAGAEVGRRRGGGRRVWPATAALWAPAWVAERAVTSWVALAARARGGVRYRGVRIRRAATPVRLLAPVAAEATRRAEPCAIGIHAHGRGEGRAP